MAGFLPILSVHLAYGLNIQAGLEGCNPYWDGCISVSAAARSGPGLWWFKGLAIPSALLMVLAWRGLTAWGLGPVAARLGMVGAAFFLVYAAALGTDGDVYRWMRRYGVVFYFGLTGLVQLLLARSWMRLSPRPPALGLYLAVLTLTWCTGIASALKRSVIDNPVTLDRVESALEWWFSLGLSLGFVAMSLVIYQAGKSGRT